MVSGKALGAHRPWIIIGVFVFAAVATPSTDPFSMLFLAIPMVVLFVVSEVIARLIDRRRERRKRRRDDDDVLDDRAPSRSTPSTCPTGSATGR